MKLRSLRATLLILLLILPTLSPALANSVEPPGLTVIVSFPPEDLTLSIRFADGGASDAIRLQREERAWEAYYRFFYGAAPGAQPSSFEGAVLVAQSDTLSFDCPLPATSFGRYNNLATLNLADRSVAVGQAPGRIALLVAMRVILSLVIEGLVFLAFGYRRKASWLIFFVMNLVTQGLLNALLTGPNLGGYWMFGYLLGEFAVFAVETTACALLLKERKTGVAIVYALAANAASLALGGVLLAYLPM